jgi:leucyl-tRNA synthetase
MICKTGLKQQDIEPLALKHENVAKFVDSKNLVKVIYIENKLINLVVK